MPADEKAQPGRDARVTLRPVTEGSLRSVLALAVAEDQRRFVADNATSIAEAYFEPKAWFRAIYADETPVGFVMLYVDEATSVYYLWRFMIDARYQGFGYGRRAMALIVDYVRTLPHATELQVSYVPGSGSPLTFYRKQGFVDTGKIDHGELVMRRYLRP